MPPSVPSQLATGQRGCRPARAGKPLPGPAYCAQGDYRRAMDCFRQTVASLEGARRRERFGQTGICPPCTPVLVLAWCHAELGTFAEGRALGEEGLRIAEAVGITPVASWCASWGIGLLSLRQGDLRRALPLLERAVDICQDADLPPVFPRVAAALGAAYTLAGRVRRRHAAADAGDGTGRNQCEHGRLQALCQPRLAEGRHMCWPAAWRKPRPCRARACAAREHQERGTRGVCPATPRRDRGASGSTRESSRPKPTTGRPSRWPRSWACARSWPTATAASACSISS